MVVNIFVIAAIVIPTFTTAHDYGRAAGCMNNLKRLHVALLVYAEEHDGKLPDAANWCDAIQKQVPERLTFRCATSGGQYRFNRNLSGIALSRVAHAESTVLLFESNGGWNASGAAADLPAKPTHRGGCNVLFVDGHVERVATTRLRQLRWQSNE
jgi:prepilin-type processing-associated H-X9-DG protein